MIMSDPKELPSNIEQLEEKPAFKKIENENTVKQLEAKLRGAKVAFYSADNKPDLIWRWMDSQGISFEDDQPVFEDEPTPTDKATDDDKQATSDTPDADEQAASTSEAERAEQAEQQPSETTVTAPPPIQESRQADIETVGEQVDRPDLETVIVQHTGAFNILEPATGTLIYAGETTILHSSLHVTTAQILRNIEQYNSNRGNVLHVVT
jgi:hypothetical protein